jgi:hypothetical protein
VAAANGKLKLSVPPKRIFPVCVGYEAALDSFWVNRYGDDLFRELSIKDLRGRVRPLTVMSVESFETVVPYTSAGDIPWTEFLARRFYDDKVVDYSVSQAIYDWRVEKKIEVRRNALILKEFESIFKKALAKYKEDSFATVGVPPA